MSNGGFLGPEATYSVAINSNGGSWGDGHLEVGAGIAVEEFHDRIILNTKGSQTLYDKLDRGK